MKILNIQLKDEVYEMVVKEAKNVDRSVRNMVSVLVERGLSADNQSTKSAPVMLPAQQLNGVGVDGRVDHSANKFSERKRMIQEHPRLQEIEDEIDELSDGLDGIDDHVIAKEVMEHIKELQDEKNDIIKEIENNY